MSGIDQFLFELFTHGTIQNQFLHILLTLVEYYPLLLSSLSSIDKISNYNLPVSNVENKKSFLMTIFPYRCQNKGFDNLIILILFIAVGVLIIFYYAFIIISQFLLKHAQNSAEFSRKSRTLKNLGNIYVNFYDIFFFRYFSGYVMLFLSNIFFYYLINNGSLLILAAFMYVFYVISSFNQINTYFVIIQISNESISRDKGKYPFDIIYTKPVDALMFIVKVLVSLEYSSTHMHTNVNLFSVAMNILILVILSFIAVKYSFQLTTSNSIDFYIFNKNLHLVRMAMNIFNVYFLILTTLFIKSDTHVSIFIGIAVMSVLWAFFTVCIIWLLRIKGKFFDGKITLQKLLYIMVQSKREAELVVTTKESFFNVNLIKIQDSIEFQHRVNCVEFSKCQICNKYTRKEPVTIFDLYKHILKQGDAIVHNELDILYRDLIKLFYYHIKKKIFKFYQWYRQIYIKFDKVDKTIVNNLAYIISLCLSYYDSFNVVSFGEIFQFTTLNDMIESHLTNIKNFIAAPNELKYVEKFFSLSCDIRKLRDYMLYILQHIEMKDDISSATDTFSKSVKNIYRYNLFLNRYAVETLTNSRYKELNELNLEIFDEYLSTHYENDKLLLLNLDMDHQNQHNNNGYYITNNSYNILKSGKEFITYRGKKFVDMLPKKLRKIGLESFINKLRKYIDYETLEGFNVKEAGSINTTLFQYVINDKFEQDEIALLNYSFKISRSLIDEHLVIYGYYDGLGAKIAMYKYSQEFGTMKLENFSSNLHSLFYFNAEWIEILEKANEFIFFTTLFKNYQQTERKKNITSSKNLVSKEETSNGMIDYECVIDFDDYSKKLNKFYKLLTEYYNTEINNQNDKVHNTQQLKEITEYLSNINDKAGHRVRLRMKLVMEIKSGSSVYKVYNIVVINKKKKTVGIELKEEEHFQGNFEDWEEEQDISVNSSVEKLQKNYGSANGSITESSVSARLSQKSRSRKDMKFSSMINTQNSKTDKISRAFARFSLFIALLNVVIITICIIFLIIQIITTKKLKRVNTLNYEFKRIRIIFAHSFLSVFTGKCIANMKETNCVSYFKDYSSEIIAEENYPEDYNVADYIITEIKYKVDDMQTTYYTFKENLFSYGDSYLLTTLSDEMIYTSFEQKEGELIQQSLSISLDEGFRKYINAFSVLVNNDFSTIPVYIISFRNSLVDFSNMNSQNLSEVQTQIYLILLNYVNYSQIFMNSETRLNSEYNRVSNQNHTMLLTFMLIIAFLNLGFLILCVWNILIVTQLFLNFITGMIMVMSDKDFKAFYVERIDRLIKISQLYVENPNTLIDNIKREETRLIKKLQLKSKATQEKNTSESYQTEKDNHLIKKQEKEIKNYYVDETKVKKVLIPFFIRLFEIFIVYFIVLIIFDCVIFSQFNSLFNINNYIINNYQVETQMYDILVLTQVMTLLNLTQNDFAESLGIDNPDEDGVINMKIRETSKIIKEIQNEEKNSDSFSMINEFSSEEKCDSVFKNINNSLTYLTIQESGIDYYDLQGLLCERFEVMSLESFEYMFNDYIFRVQKLQNLITSYDYESLLAFNKKYVFYDLTTMVLLNMQPLRNYIRVVLLDKLMNSTITHFILIITLYLCGNILVDISMHFIIKYSITGKLDIMHRDLLMFNNCFSS